MSINRIKAIVLQEIFISARSVEIIVDLPFMSAISIVIFGVVYQFLTESASTMAANYLLLGMLLWEIIRVNQYSVSVGSLWNIWSRNLSNIFTSPISLKEYLFAQMLSGLLKAIVIFIIVCFLAQFLFKFDILQVGFLNLILYFINLILFSWVLGIIILGFIFRYGTRIQALAWGIIFLFQPLCAAFFPVSILPSFFQTIAYTLPATYVFETARYNLVDPTTNWYAMGVALALNIIYLSISIIFFNIMFNASKNSGQFARNEG